MSKLSNKSIFVIVCIIIGVVFLYLYFNKWHQVREQEKYLDSYLMQTNTINLEMLDINEINNVLSETPSYYFIYISYTKDETVYNLEKKLKPLIDEYNIQNNFYYLNVTEIKEINKNYRQDIAKELNIDKSIIDKVPIILYFKDGNLVNKGIYSAKEFESFLKNENIKSM